MKELIKKSTITLKEALKNLEYTGKKCIVIVDGKRKLLGTLTDGDLRASILSGTDLNSSIKKIYNSKPTYLLERNFDENKVKKLFLSKRFDLIPVVNKNKIVVDVITWDVALAKQEKYFQKKIDTSVIIMAGGLGKRLRPFTNILPKPLIPIGGKAIIEHIIDKFVNFGVKDFYISINYKSKLIKAYFEEAKIKGYKINYIEEKKPLGTIGSLNFIKRKFKKPIILTNSDIIVKSNLADIYFFHLKKKNDITLIASAKDYIIPYGVCKLDKKGYLKNIDEKPEYNFLINTGLYVLNPSALKIIPKNKKYDASTFINDAKKKGMKIGVYPIGNDSWMDVGQWPEYKEAAKIINNE